MTCKDFYFDFIKREIDKLEQGNFTGNIEFQVNFFNGSIANINSNLHRSIKFSDKKDEVKI